MQKETTNKEAESLFIALNEFANSDNSVPVEVGFRIMQNIKSLEPAMEVYRSEISRIIARYSKDGETVKKEDDPGKYAECLGKLQELGNIKISVPVECVNAEQFKGLKVPMKQMFALMFISKESGVE